MSVQDKDKHSKRSIWAWCLFDWGNSAFPTVIITFVFSVYFARGIVGDETAGAALWGYAVALSGFVIALCGPVLGALADHYGARKPGLLLFSLLCIIPTAFLYFAVPGLSGAAVLVVLAVVVIANIGFEISLVYANAMLPHIAPPAMLGRVSGWAWGLGYIGGLCCLALALVGLVGLGDVGPFLPLPDDASQNVRATAPLVALWYFIFMLPLLFFTHDTARTGLGLRAAAGRGIAQLRTTIREVRHHKNLALFLCSSALYRDGLNTLFAMGGLYAAGQFGMSMQEILIFAIGLNVTAGLGALLFSFGDDRIGSKPVVIIALLGLMTIGVAILMIDDKIAFIGLALFLGLFVGPAQAASRTLVTRLSPPALVAQSYGLYAFTGKSISFMGPLAYGAATTAFGTQQAGMLTILLFWLAGLVFLLLVKDNRGHEDHF